MQQQPTQSMIPEPINPLMSRPGYSLRGAESYITLDTVKLSQSKASSIVERFYEMSAKNKIGKNVEDKLIIKIADAKEAAAVMISIFEDLNKAHSIPSNRKIGEKMDVFREEFKRLHDIIRDIERKIKNL